MNRAAAPALPVVSISQLEFETPSAMPLAMVSSPTSYSAISAASCSAPSWV
jgi:hypothetical protein